MNKMHRLGVVIALLAACSDQQVLPGPDAAIDGLAIADSSEVGAADTLREASGDQGASDVASELAPDVVDVVERDLTLVDGGLDARPTDVAADAGADLTHDASPTDTAISDVVRPDAAPSDSYPVDAASLDATLDATLDIAAVDLATDVMRVDTTPDATAMDLGADVARDTALPEVARDTALPDTAPPDTALDVARTDTVGCLGDSPRVAVTAPAPGEAIETCTTSGLPVYYAFMAQVVSGAPLTVVAARWITPDGTEAPPTFSSSAAPWVFRRQVGGPSTGVPALAVFGLRGQWRFEVTVHDSCGRLVTTAQLFTLTFAAAHRCPNP